MAHEARSTRSRPSRAGPLNARVREARALVLGVATALSVVIAVPEARAQTQPEVASEITETQTLAGVLQAEIARYDSLIQALERDDTLLALTPSPSRDAGMVTVVSKQEATDRMARLAVIGGLSPQQLARFSRALVRFKRLFLQELRDLRREDHLALAAANDRLSYLYGRRDRLAGQPQGPAPRTTWEPAAPALVPGVAGASPAPAAAPAIHAHGRWRNTRNDSGEWDLTLTLGPNGVATGRWGGAQNAFTGTWSGNVVHWVDGKYDVTCTLSGAPGGRIVVDYNVPTENYSGRWESN